MTLEQHDPTETVEAIQVAVIDSQSPPGEMSDTSAVDVAIDITPMTREEARKCADTIKGNLESLRSMLLQLQRREGWKALGYSSWRECAQEEFGQSQGYVYKLLYAAEVEENLAADGIIQLDKSEYIPISQLEELHKLPPDKQTEGLQKANELANAEGKPRTAAHVAKAVQIIKKPTSVAQEIVAQGKSLGMPTRGDSVLPESDQIDDLNHLVPADVDARPGAFPARATPEPEVPADDNEHLPIAEDQGKADEKYNSDEQYTPEGIIDAVLERFGGRIALDPCSNSHINPNVPADKYFTKEDDGLKQDWTADNAYINPPYSDTKSWIIKTVDEIKSGKLKEAIALTQADTSTQWFQLIWKHAAAVCFVEGRLEFSNPKNKSGARFASALAYFGENVDRFYQEFHGTIGVCVPTPPRLQAAQSEILHLKSKCEQLHEQVQSLQELNAELHEKLQKEKEHITTGRRVLMRQVDENSSLKAELETVKKELHAVEKQLGKTQVWAGGQSEENDTLKEKIERLTSENERFKEKLATLTPTEPNRNELTRMELGELLGVSDETISNWEKNGKLEKERWKYIPGTGGRGNSNPRLYRNF